MINGSVDLCIDSINVPVCCCYSAVRTTPSRILSTRSQLRCVELDDAKP